MKMSETGGKRRAISIKRKVEIIEAVEKKQPSKKKSTIAEEFQIHPSTLTALIKNKDDYKRQFYSGTIQPWRQKRFRLAKHEQVDKQLLEWLHNARSEDIHINGRILKSKAEELAQTLGIQNWKCTEGWLYRWKKRHNVSYAMKSSSSRKESFQEQPTENWVEDVLKPTLEWYEPKNVFTLDETALFWQLLPDKVFRFKGDGRKLCKNRLTVMLCCNMDGSEKLPLLTIGKLRKPTCFTGLKRLPVQYAANLKAWMSADILKDWLQSFDMMMHEQNRKILLVMDTCFPHKVEVSMKAIEILYLPSCAATNLLPCSLGITHSLKVHYRTMKILKLVAHTNAGGTTDNYPFTLFDALCTLKCAWEKVSPLTISNCFHKACFNANETSADLPREQYLVDAGAQEVLLSRYCGQWNISLMDYFSIDDDVLTMEPERHAYIHPPSTSTACPPSVMEETNSDENDECGEQKDRVSIRTVLGCVQEIGTYCWQAGCNDSVINSFNAFVQVLDRHLAYTEHQTKITHFFPKRSQTEEKIMSLGCDCESKVIHAMNTKSAQEEDGQTEDGRMGDMEKESINREMLTEITVKKEQEDSPVKN